MIGERIKKYRKQIGMSQTELADAIGIAQSAVSSWERGGSRPSIDNIRAAASALRVNVEILLDIPQTPHSAFERYARLTPDQQNFINQMIAVMERSNRGEGDGDEAEDAGK